jgi:hypothetical protein
VWDLERAQPCFTFNVGGRSAVTALAFSPNRSLVVGGGGGECCIFDCVRGSQTSVDLARLDELPGGGMPEMASLTPAASSLPRWLCVCVFVCAGCVCSACACWCAGCALSVCLLVCWLCVQHVFVGVLLCVSV